MKTIQDYKKEAVLNKNMNFDGKIMSRREWLKIKLAEGWEAEEKQVAAVQYDRRKFNRMNWQQQQEYEKRMAETKKEYRLKIGDEYYVITKTEFEAFKSLQLEEDINTQKTDLSERIEAGIATDEEINKAMQKEFEFAAKYF